MYAQSQCMARPIGSTKPSMRVRNSTFLVAWAIRVANSWTCLQETSGDIYSAVSSKATCAAVLIFFLLKNDTAGSGFSQLLGRRGTRPLRSMACALATCSSRSRSFSTCCRIILFHSGLIINQFENAANPSLWGRPFPYFLGTPPTSGYWWHLLLGEETVTYVPKNRCASGRTA